MMRKINQHLWWWCDALARLFFTQCMISPVHEDTCLSTSPKATTTLEFYVPENSANGNGERKKKKVGRQR